MMFYFPFLEATSAAEYTLMNDDSMGTNGRFVSQNTISFVELLKTKENVERGKEVTAVLGITTIFILLLTFFVIKKVDNKYKELYLLFIIFSLISVFMASKFFPWLIMPNIICKLQYPWRMIGFLTFFISFICGINLYNILKLTVKKDFLKIIIVALFVTISIINSMSVISKYFSTNNMLDKNYETNIVENKKIACKRINRDYMPFKALILQNTYVLDRKDTTYVLDGYADILDEKKENLTDNIKIKNVMKDTILEFPYFYYVGYEITLETENKIQRINSIESKNGYVSCIIPQDIDEGTIKVEYTSTLITKISYITSAISAILFIVYIIFQKKKIKEETNND